MLAAGIVAGSGCSCEDEGVLLKRERGTGTTDTTAQLAPCVDRDGDGYGDGGGCLGADCDDSDPALGGDGERACYSGPEGSLGVGRCAQGRELCVGGRLEPCAGDVVPGAETCDGTDEDCDGQVDEEVSRACYSGPEGTEGVEACAGGTQRCAGGGLWGACEGEVLPAVESCDGVDEDCDGRVDEELSRACYTGPEGTLGNGLCAQGSETCAAGLWGACKGETLPAPESCDGKDNDCDGLLDEGLAQHCYSGPEGTEGQGICQGGMQVCSAGSFGACLGETTPGSVEVCDSGLDEDCDGMVDELPCAGVGTHVCNSCPGASDSNPGTQERPLLTIERGIYHALLYGFDRVYVANQSAAVAGVYGEDITMVEGVSLDGRWVPGTPWTRDALVRAVIENPTAEGLKVPAGVTRRTRLEGFEVLAAGGHGASSESAAISVVESSPTLRDIKAGGLKAGAPVPGTSLGIKVSGSAGAPANPRIEGISSSRLAQVDGGQALSEASGILVSGAQIDAQLLQVTGGRVGAGGTSRGIVLLGAPGSQVRDSRVGGGNGSSCAGLFATGDVDRIVLERNGLRGCESGPVTPSRGAGALFSGCQPGAGLAAPTLRSNSELTGGLVPGGVAIGLAALDGCPIEALDNPSVSGGSSASQSIGVLCSHQSWSGTAGADSACVLLRNTIFGGLTTTVGEAVGIACEGSCQGKSASCAGSCALLSGNTVSGGAGLSLIHVRIAHSSPLVERNRIGTLAPACLKDTQLVGLSLRGSSSRVESNFVIGGPCEKVWGLMQLNEQRADGSWPAPDIHSNTIVGGGSTVSLTASESVGVGFTTLGSYVAPPLGSYRNNLIVGGQNLHRVSMAEYDADSDPAVLDHNDLFNFEVSGGPKAELYLNESSNALLLVSEVNALSQTASQANLSVDPSFVNTLFDFHLQAASPVRGLGTTTGAPASDIDGDPRPSPYGTLPDLGADELL